MIVVRLLPETESQLTDYEKGKFWFICNKTDRLLRDASRKKG
jgi:hypothetical protein